MGKLPVVRPNQAIKAFQNLGFVVGKKRGSGSHVVLIKAGHLHLTIPVHKGADLKKGLLRRLIRDAGVTVDEFLAAL